MLRYRIASALVGIPVILLVIWLGGIIYATVVGIVLVIASAEFHRHSPSYRRPLAIISAALAGLLGVAPAFQSTFPLLPLLVTLAVTLPLAWAVLRLNPESAIETWAFAVSSVIFVGILGSHLTALRFESQGREWVLLAVLTTWIIDTAAYTAGRAFGKHKLAPLISPGKTVEGGVAGYIMGAFAVVGLHEALQLNAGAWTVGALAVLLPLLGQIGDLGESLLKRGLHVKDSGNLIPGHGGVMDRIDSLVWVVAATYYIIQL